jgi:UDP-N-acetylmuramoylalanine--D-glutamate ligase
VFEHLPQVWVLELSSFQLDGVHNFEPTAAAVLNVTQDHLDWHGTMAAYAAAKARIFGRQALMVINRDDAAVEAMLPQPPEPELGRSGKPLKVQSKTVRGWAPRRVQRFGLDAPRQPGDWGLSVENGMAWLVRAMEADDTPMRPRRGALREEEPLLLQRLMPADALRIRGRHNVSNALAALALATAAGLPLAPMLHGLREYRGEPHRVEYLQSVAGVEAFDDSKGTNVGATVAALLGLGPDKAPNKLVVILGGDGKGQDFAPLVPAVAEHARAVALIGRDGPAIAELLSGLDLPQQIFESLEQATRWCFEQARPGDGVLLSPACASLDMFRNYAHRAQVFADTVAQIAADRGEMA